MHHIDLLIHNAELVTCAGPGPRRRQAMRDVGALSAAAVAIHNEHIIDIGPSHVPVSYTHLITFFDRVYRHVGAASALRLCLVSRVSWLVAPTLPRSYLSAIDYRLSTIDYHQRFLKLRNFLEQALSLIHI